MGELILLFLLIGGLAGLGFMVYLVLKRLSSGSGGGSGHEADLARLQAQVQAQKDSLTQAEEQKKQLQTQINELTRQVGSLSAQNQDLAAKQAQAAQEKEAELATQKSQLERSFQKDLELALSQAQVEKEKQLAELQANNQALEARIKDAVVKFREQDERHKLDMEQQSQLRREIMAQLDEMKKQVGDTFAKVSAEALEKSGTHFLDKAKANLESVLTPIREFREKVEKQIEQGVENKSIFETQIKALKESTERIQLDAQKLTEALRGNKKIQGNWGEIQLVSLLERSGLKEGSNYEVQFSVKSEEGEQQYFDVLVKLPEGKSIIIDAKVSLNAYVEALNADSEEASQAALKAHVGALRTHISGLSAKHYYKAKGINAPEYVLMFIPIETAFIAATTEDPALWNFGYDKKVILVSPSTLMATLLAVNSVWKQERRKENAEKIAQEAAAIYDKLVTFSEAFEKIEKSLGQAQESYTKAKGVLVDGKGNAIRRLEHLKELGISPKKQLGREILESAHTEEVKTEADGFAPSAGEDE